MFAAIMLFFSLAIISQSVPGGQTVQEDFNQGGGGGGGVSCCCGMLWGKGCKADNHGSTCAPAGVSQCWDYDKNCTN